MSRLLMIVVAALATTAQAAPRLTEADVRAFVARQSQAWNAGDLAAYFALYLPSATFTDQGRSKDGRLVPYGASTLSEARRQTRRSRATTGVREASAIRAIRMDPGGKGATIVADEDIRLTEKGRARRLCAERVQAVVLTPAGLRSKGQTDTYVACPRG
jgi:hypothetical protein